MREVSTRDISSYPAVLLVVEGVVVVVALADPPVPAGGQAGQEGDEGPQERDGHCNVGLYLGTRCPTRTHTKLPPGPAPPRGSR